VEIKTLSIQTIVEYLNKTKGYAIPSDYYEKIGVWRDWWRGFYKPFHEYREVNGTKTVKRKLFTLKMAKKVCEDWASILLNEKTQIVIDDKTSSEFVQGKDEAGGVFKENDFWAQGNALVEKVFMCGTGAFVLKLAGMQVQGESIIKDKDTRICVDYLTALNIIPLTIRNGKIVEVAFVSEVLEKGKKYIYLETHELSNGNYQITNQYFQYENGKLTEKSLPPGIAPKINTGADVPLFSIFSPNIVNTADDANGLGMAVYAQAIDNLEGVDLAFNNFCRDFKLGGKKVFYNASLIQIDEEGNAIAPDDVMQQLFMQVGDDYITENGNKLVQEFNPSLRVAENKDGIQAQLDYLSFKCGLGTKHYQFNAGSVVTATQYMGDKQELIQNASKHYIIIEKALQDIVRAILWVGREVLGESVDPDAQITITFDDSYVIDKESERQRDLQEIRDGVMQKYEYRMKWYGEDEKTAKAMTEGQQTDDNLMGFGDG
jgi:A118 family predicted phage portal protein